jgi:hypothetical protein
MVSKDKNLLNAQSLYDVADQNTAYQQVIDEHTAIQKEMTGLTIQYYANKVVQNLGLVGAVGSGLTSLVFGDMDYALASFTCANIMSATADCAHSIESRIDVLAQSNTDLENQILDLEERSSDMLDVLRNQ